MTNRSRFRLTTFTFPFQGTNRSSVFVNANGNLTFGAPNGDFSETVPEFLDYSARFLDLPRAAS